MTDNEGAPLLNSQFKIDKQTLATIVSKYRERTKNEEVEFLEQICQEDSISNLLNVNPSYGIDLDDIKKRREVFESGPIDKESRVGAFGAILLVYYVRYLMFILMALCITAGTVQLITGTATLDTVLSDCFIAIAVCLIYMILTTLVRYFAHIGEGRKLREVIESLKYTNVFREGKLINVHYSELVTGDIIQIKKGMFTPADTIVLEGQNLTVDEFRQTKDHTILQKETLNQCCHWKTSVSSEIEEKNALPSPVILSGSYILSGEGKGMVLLAGSASTLTSVQKITYTYTGTNLQLKLEIAGLKYLSYGIRTVIVTFLVLILRFFLGVETENWVQEILIFLMKAAGILTFITIEDFVLILHDIMGRAVRFLLQEGVLPMNFLAFDGIPFVTDICVDKNQMELEPEVFKQALGICSTAEIRVKVIVGEDSTITKEEAVALGVVPQESPDLWMVEASEFEKQVKKDKDLESGDIDKSFITGTRVFKSSKAQDKELLVYSLQENQCLVAYIGKSCEDIQIMKNSNVSFALASGKDLTKYSADFVLIKENIMKVIETIRWGRNIHENTLKYFQFRAPTIISVLAISFVGSACFRDPVFETAHLIWMLLIIELSARFLLAIQPPNEEIMKHKPIISPSYSIITKNMKKHIVGQAMYQILFVLILLFTGEYWVPEDLNLIYTENGVTYSYNLSGHVRPGRYFSYSGLEEEYGKFEDAWGISRHYTLIFNTFAFMVIFNIINCQTLRDELNLFKGTKNNLRFIVLFVIIVCIQYCVGNYTGNIFSISPYGMNPAQWMIAFSAGFGSLVISLILRLFKSKADEPQEVK